MVKSIRGSKKLGRWVENDAVEVIQRIDNGARQKDAAIVLKIKRTGKVIVIVSRKNHESYKQGRKTITAARKDQVETWGVDGRILDKVRALKPDFVVIFLTNTDHYWVSRFSAWINPKIRIRRTSKYSSEPIYHLPSHLMKHVPEKTNLRFNPT